MKKKIKDITHFINKKSIHKRIGPYKTGKKELLTASIRNRQGKVALELNTFKKIIKSRVKGDIIKTNRIVTDYLITIGEINKKIYFEKVKIEYKGAFNTLQKRSLVVIITKLVQEKYLSFKKYEKIDTEKIVSEIINEIKGFDLNFIYKAFY